jgi:GGDEF domain-containing protein
VAIVVAHNKVRRLKPRVLIVTGPDKTPASHPTMWDLLYDPKLGGDEPAYIKRGLPAGAYGPRPPRLLPCIAPRWSSSARAETGREALLKFLDRETAIARATGGRLSVLILELRRVDRVQALLRGPAPATTMSLVVDRLEKAVRPEDRVAPINDEQVCLVLPRLAHPSQAVLAAVKLLRALDRPSRTKAGARCSARAWGSRTFPSMASTRRASSWQPTSRATSRRRAKRAITSSRRRMPSRPRSTAGSTSTSSAPSARTSSSCITSR